MVRALRAEWTKLRSVRSTALALFATIGLTVLISLVGAAGSGTNVNDGPQTIDQFHFVHQSLRGDGSITARVVSQRDSGEWAKAGIVVKDGTTSGSPYAAVMVTPAHGVRMQVNAATEVAADGAGTTGAGTGTDAAAGSTWLRLTRVGDVVTGLSSVDGVSWQAIAELTVAGLPPQAQAGLFVASPSVMELRRDGPGGVQGELVDRPGQAVFDNVTVSPTADAEGRLATDDESTDGSGWTSTDVMLPPPSKEAPRIGGGIAQLPGDPGTVQEDSGVFTVTGSGNLGRVGMGGITLPAFGDTVKDSLVGAQLGLVAAVALGVLFMTSEYKTRTLRVTFAASPGRAKVLAAKAIVLGATVFVAGLAASAGAFFAARPLQRLRGFAAPAFPDPSLTDPAVLRAVVGTAAALAVIAVLGLAVGTILRRTAAAIILMLAVLFVLPIVATVTSIVAGDWVGRATPVAGLAIAQTKTLIVTPIGPWQGFGVLCAYTVAALFAAFVLIRRRDA